MASMYSHTNTLEDLVQIPVVKGTGGDAATLIVKSDIARQAALASAGKWKLAAGVLAGAVIYLTYRSWR